MIVNMIPPYRVALYEELHRQLGDGLHILRPDGGEPDRGWPETVCAVPQSAMPGVRLRRAEGRVVHVGRGVQAALTRLRPDGITVSGFGPQVLSAMLWAARHRVPVVSMMEANHHSDPPATRWTRRFLVPRCAAGIVIGTRSRSWLRHNGLPESRLFTAPLVPVAPPPAPTERPIDMLWVGALQKRKGIDRFVALVRALRPDRVVIAGDGPERKRAQRELVGTGTEFLGQIDPVRAARLPARAKLVMIPSRYDSWPLSATEAAACGTPVLISDRAGAAGDLIRHGKEGLVLPGESLPAWIKGARDLFSDPDRRDRMGRAAATRAAEATLGRSVDAHLAAFRSALA